MSARSMVLYGCFFISGASALIYEIIWQRMLTLVFGVSTMSIAAVVAAFLGGLAVGARIFGRWADQSPNPGRLYAKVELAIALAGLASGRLIPPLMEAFTAIYQQMLPGWLGSNLIRFVLAFAAFGVPSVLIGATVPLMARLLAERAQSVGVGFGRFYAINTLGSVAGASLAGFVLIRFVGVQYTLYCAVAGNVVVALTMWLVPTGVKAATQIVDRVTQADQAGRGASCIQQRYAIGLAGLCGAVALAYEIVWTRLMAIFTFNSVYVFTMVVSVFLTGLALGSAVAAWLMRRGVHRLRLFGAVQIGLAMLTVLTLSVITSAGELGIGRSDELAGRILLQEYSLAVGIILLPAILIGMTLPLLVGLLGADAGQAGRSVGRVYAWNAVGTIVGVTVTGVFLIPLLGLRGTLLGLAAVNCLIAAVAVTLDEKPPRFWRGLVPWGAGLMLLLVAFLPAEARYLCRANQPDETVIYYAEGPSATVHVSQFGAGQDSYRILSVDSKSVAGTYDEIVTDQKMLAHVPLLLHPDPQLALTVGFGTGGTSYSMLQHKINVHCVEIEPYVAQAYEFFDGQNKGVVGPQHNRHDFRLILDDARAWLHVAPQNYDVIVTDVTSIQYRGNGNLYTAEYFQLIQERLNPGGLGCAWVPISGITPRQLKILIRTFGSVFPHTSAWYMINLPTDFVILVGSPEPLIIPLDKMARRMEATLVQRDLAEIGMENPYKLAACLLLAGNDVAAYAGDGVLHTDDHPVLDYLTHATSKQKTLTVNLSEMMDHRSDAAQYVDRWPDSGSTDRPPSQWTAWYRAAGHLMEGHALLYGVGLDRRDAMHQAYQAAAELVPDDRTTQHLVSDM